ncbi:site-specific integrase [Haematomicrobium sanguinis]|uniref:site-specific integrase n=1 Tax=Haematomicrobium sanguinis TaxID=479106 RepID=UPI00047ACD5A|nr:site-specific integrase [Haematomicrobium sanguinis]
MASIESYPTANGKRYRVRYRTPNRRQTTKRGFTTKRDAELFLANIEVSKARGDYIAPALSKTTVGALGDAWLARQTQLKASAKVPLESAWRNHVKPRWDVTRIGDVRHSEIQSWIAGLTSSSGKELSATMQRRCLGILSGILADAVKDRLLSANPAEGIKTKRKPKPTHTYLTHEQVTRLAECSKYPELIFVLAYCGLRWGEAVALRVQDFDPLRLRINVNRTVTKVNSALEIGTPKTHEIRSVGVPKFLIPRISRLCEGRSRGDLIFPNERGGFLRHPVVKGTRYSWFDSAVQDAKIPRITPHDLRATAASLAVRSQANVKAVQKMLGHASAAMTLDRYADLFDNDVDLVADALDHAHSQEVVVKMWSKAT